jgi:tryptophan synthase alpha chain
VRDRLAADIAGLVARVRAQSALPVAVGFGISSPEQVAEACVSADAAVVGSALVSVIEEYGAEHGQAGDVAERAGEYVRWLKSAV